MQRLLSVIVTALSLAGCENDDSSLLSAYQDSEINLIIRNGNGQNLLDPATSGHFNADSVRIYYMVNGTKTEVNNEEARHPHGFMVYREEQSKTYLMRVILYPGTTQYEETKTVIQWNTAMADTVSTLMERYGLSYYCNRVSYNGVTRYDLKSPYYSVVGRIRVARKIEVVRD